MKDLMIYTGVFGELCRSRIPEVMSGDFDSICYTDLNIYNPFYTVKKIDLNSLDSVRRNRFIKILIPDEIFSNYEYSLYVDYKHPMRLDFDALVRCMGNADFLVSPHPKRDCVYEEGAVCMEKGKGIKSEIKAQLAYYEKMGLPSHNGLYANYWIFRKHTEQLRQFSHTWWEQVKRFSYRDQLSLPFVAWQKDYKIALRKRGE